MTDDTKNALVLTGGGARAAYQVGALQALLQLRRESARGSGHDGPRSPFQILVGSSAGAINAAALACDADDFGHAVEMLGRVWGGFHADQVYRTDALRVIQSGAKWMSMLALGWLLSRSRLARPRSLLNNEPLADLLRGTLQLHRLDRLLADGTLHAVAVTGSNYSSGRHVTFYQSHRDIVPWSRSQRFAVRTRIGGEHLLASAAIPFVFPAVPIEVDGRRGYFGDGSMREMAPVSPAIHLGADRILVIGSGRLQEPDGASWISDEYPNLAQIAGHALSSIFLDSLSADIARIERINALLSATPSAGRERFGMRYIEVLAITPSRRIDTIAAESVAALPMTIRGLLRGIGVSSARGDMQGAALASYLLFESEFTQALMRLGAADTMDRRAEIERFFGWNRSPDARFAGNERAESAA